MFNPNILAVIDKYKLNKDLTLTFLLTVFYDLKPLPIPPLVKQVLFQERILYKNYETSKETIEMSLFVKEEDTLNWVDEYRELFRGIKLGSMGDRNGVVKNLKKFIKNTKCTKKQILDATKYYIKNTDPKYIQKAHYFVYKSGTSTLGSIIEEGYEKEDEGFDFTTKL